MSSSPSSRAPAGVPSSNGKYVAVAAILFLGIASLVVWKFVLSKPETPPPTTVNSALTASAAKENPKEEEVPEVPIIEPKAEASAPVASVKPTVTGPVGPGGPGGGCDAVCPGKDPGTIAGALQARAAASRSCYNKALSNDQGLRGRVVISVKIGSAGQVCSASVASDEMNAPAVSQCAANIFRSGSYPPPVGGCLVASIPLNFTH